MNITTPTDTNATPSTTLTLTDQEMIMLLRDKGYTIGGEQPIPAINASSTPTPVPSASSTSPTTVSIDNSKTASGSIDPALLLMMMQYQQQHQLTMAQLAQSPSSNNNNTSQPAPIINVNASSNNNNNIHNGQTYNPNLILQPVPVLSQLPDFSTGLFDCCSDCSVCFCGTFFPCCQYGLNHYRMKNYSIPQFIERCISYNIVCPFLTCFVHSRSETRMMLGLRPDPNDACVVTFCPFCAVCQEGREIKKRQTMLDQKHFQQSLVLTHLHPQQVQQPVYIVNPPMHQMR